MKFLLTILFFLLGIVSFAQTQTDGVNDKEIERILRNYRDHNIREFSLTSTTTWNNKKLWKENFYFVFESDSIFQTKWSKDLSRYLITDKGISYIYSKEDSAFSRNYFNIDSIDSEGYKISYRYLIQNTDTTLTDRSRTFKDTLNGKYISIYTSYLDNNELKTIKYEQYVSGDTIIDGRWTLVANEWLPDSKFKTYTNILLQPEVEIILTYTTGRNYIRPEDHVHINDFRNIEIKSVYYSKKGLIKYIEIKNLNCSGDEISEELELILPVIKEKSFRRVN